MHTVTLSLKTITPLFLGGAEPNASAELRAPAFKAALRYWYRAIDPEYNQRRKKDGPTLEEYLFGSAGYGTGLFRLVTSGPAPGTMAWDPNRYRVFDKEHPECPAGLSQDDKRRWILNGVRYLSFSLKMGENHRKAIPVGQPITATMRFRAQPDQAERRAIAAAWWLLGHVGGLGSRSRRGFGTVALQSWTTDGERWNELDELPIAHTGKTPDEWLATFQEGLQILKSWYETAQKDDHLVLGPNTGFYLVKDGYGQGTETDPNTKKPLPIEGWEYAMNRAGRLMQDFRQRRSPDYDNVRNHLADQEQRRRSRNNPPTALPLIPPVRPKRLTSPPERSAFGLPLAFQYGSLNRVGYQRFRVTFQGQEHDRNASPIYIRIIQIGEKYYPFFARFDAPLLANREQVAIQNKPATPTPIGIGSQAILNDFCTTVLDSEAVKPVVTWAPPKPGHAP